VNQSLNSHIFGTGFFGGVEYSNADICDEFPAGISLNALRKIGVLAASEIPILHIGGHGNVAQIGNSVVEFVAVDVVDLTRGPDAVRHKPGEPMNLDLLAVDGRFSVSGLNGANYLIDPAKPLLDTPSENAGKRIIVKKLPDSSERDFGNSHVARTSLWVEGRL